MQVFFCSMTQKSLADSRAKDREIVSASNGKIRRQTTLSVKLE